MLSLCAFAIGKTSKSACGNAAWARPKAQALAPARPVSCWYFGEAKKTRFFASEIQSGVPTAMVLSLFVSNSFQALFGAFFICHFVHDGMRFERLRDLTVFLFFGAFLAPFLSSFLDVAVVRQNSLGNRFGLGSLASPLSFKYPGNSYFGTGNCYLGERWVHSSTEGFLEALPRSRDFDCWSVYRMSLSLQQPALAGRQNSVVALLAAAISAMGHGALWSARSEYSAAVGYVSGD